MTVITLLNELHKELKPRNDADLAWKLGMDPAVLSRLRSNNQTSLSDKFLMRCYDYAGFSIEKTRELFRREE